MLLQAIHALTGKRFSINYCKSRPLHTKKILRPCSVADVSEAFQTKRVLALNSQMERSGDKQKAHLKVCQLSDNIANIHTSHVYPVHKFIQLVLVLKVTLIRCAACQNVSIFIYTHIKYVPPSKTHHKGLVKHQG